MQKYEKFQRFFCTGNWPLAKGYKGNHIFTSRTPVKRIWGRWALRCGKTLPTIAHTRVTIYTESCSEEKQRLAAGKKHAERKGNKMTYAFFAVETGGQYSHDRCCAVISNRGLTFWAHIQGFSSWCMPPTHAENSDIFISPLRCIIFSFFLDY